MRMPAFTMGSRGWMLAVALAAGAAAAWLSQRHIQARIDAIEAGARTETTPVLVAAADLPAGSRLDADAVAVRDMPVEWVPSAALGPARYAEIESARLAYPLRRGDPVLEVHVKTHPAFLSDRLADGRRAVTVPVDEMGSVSGLLKPGDLIDLYVSFEHRGRRTTRPLLQSVRVLATGQQLDGDAGGTAAGGGFSTLTLDASPEDAVKLVAARDGGTLTAMLRRPDDPRPAAAVPRGDLPGLLGMSDPPPPRSDGPRVSVIYGDRPPRVIPRLGPPPAADVSTDDAAAADGEASR
ncbi:Flp pilus assembly protein CpaB [Pigmentiphaga soli]|uniref:Flp pilus assembly protein CpaB n=1 Tax=Pigmentiphaga soli TaxID=1007095 RepID=A0ABP8HAI7_9BURK